MKKKIETNRQKSKEVVTHAGMRREVRSHTSRIDVPSEESVIESKKWVETNKL